MGRIQRLSISTKKIFTNDGILHRKTGLIRKIPLQRIRSFFAVQWIDLNKVGVLIGNNLQVDKAGRHFGNSDNFYNVNGNFSENDANPKNENEFTLFVLKIYYILLTRVLLACELYFGITNHLRNIWKIHFKLDNSIQI